jgi:hypothetical protein
MSIYQKQLNKAQKNELAKLCFDLAKGAFALVILQTINGSLITIQELLKIILSLLYSIAFTAMGLLLLRQKRRMK